MSESQEQSQKTEEPTHKRLEDARKKGQLANSREINSFFILTVFAVIIIVLLPHIMQQARPVFLPFIESPEEFQVDEESYLQLFKDTAAKSAMLLLLPLALAVAAALSAGFLQSRLNFSWDPLIPKLEKISPLKGLKRLFSLKSFIEFIKGIFKITLVGIIATIAIWPYMREMNLLPDMEVMEMLALLALLAKRMLIGVLIVMLFIAALDYSYQRYEYIKGLRMTKQEVRDEYKQQEGDPLVKQKLRSIRMERGRRRMMAAVPQSDVVITNPTHYAVALKYDPEEMMAPTLVAKGTDKVALRIREMAKEHKVTVMRNPPLARALYDNVEIDETIPHEYFQTVAEIIAYVYRLKGKKLEAPKKLDLG